MNLLLLGHGKTGTLVEQVARERGHAVQVLTSRENHGGSALTAEKLGSIDVVIDFTNPDAALDDILACLRHNRRIVVGTTGWYQHLDRVREQAQNSSGGIVYGSNFSIGVNVFFEVAATAAAAVPYGYTPSIVERHHVHKKDAPSGTAISIQRIVTQIGKSEPEITSVREGETVGSHVLLLDSQNDTMMLVHDSKNRRGFAEGAVLAAEWLRSKTGFYEFRNIFRELRA
ncbi:MAG TPA: dihydrodipicolinate reductase C-terminal domain-containing protein [Terriglobales bacterium]|nr:dihydrodipicolinate reductase C-terminal domain-containing protein [Terriglobales bacterium]